MTDFQTIVDDFEFLEDWEERYKYLIDLGQRLPPLEDADRNDANKVRGCASQVWLKFDTNTPGVVSFIGNSDAHIVSGLISLLMALYSGKSIDEVKTIDAKAELARLDLEDHITPQRSNGLASMIKRIRQVAETSC